MSVNLEPYTIKHVAVYATSLILSLVFILLHACDPTIDIISWFVHYDHDKCTTKILCKLRSLHNFGNTCTCISYTHVYNTLHIIMFYSTCRIILILYYDQNVLYVLKLMIHLAFCLSKRVFSSCSNYCSTFRLNNKFQFQYVIWLYTCPKHNIMKPYHMHACIRSRKKLLILTIFDHIACTIHH